MFEDYEINDPSGDDPGGGTVVAPAKETSGGRQNNHVPRYHVLLWDNDNHTYDYVEQMLRELFGYKPEQCLKIATAVDNEGKAIVITTTLEHAELKRDQIHAYGDDKFSGTKGSMWATIEPAE